MNAHWHTLSDVKKLLRCSRVAHGSIMRVHTRASFVSATLPLKRTQPFTASARI